MFLWATQKLSPPHILFVRREVGLVRKKKWVSSRAGQGYCGFSTGCANPSSGPRTSRLSCGFFFTPSPGCTPGGSKDAPHFSLLVCFSPTRSETNSSARSLRFFYFVYAGLDMWMIVFEWHHSILNFQIMSLKGKFACVTPCSYPCEWLMTSYDFDVSFADVARRNVIFVCYE